MDLKNGSFEGVCDGLNNFQFAIIGSNFKNPPACDTQFENTSFLGENTVESTKNVKFPTQKTVKSHQQVPLYDALSTTPKMKSESAIPLKITPSQVLTQGKTLLGRDYFIKYNR